MYHVELASRAQRELRRLQPAAKQRIAAALAVLAENPRPPGSLKLKGVIHRLRVGPYRLIYSISDRDETVIALKIARREKDTYDRLDDLM